MMMDSFIKKGGRNAPPPPGAIPPPPPPPQKPPKREWGASYKDATCPACNRLRPISHTELCLECWNKGRSPEDTLRKGLHDLLADMVKLSEHAIFVRHDKRSAEDLDILIKKVRALVGPLRSPEGPGR